MITINLLPALYGDTILIDVENDSKNTNILIDCGYNYKNGLLPLLKCYSAQGKVIDRFIVSHYDDDHISSAAKFIKENGQSSDPKVIKINQVWLNTYRHIQFDKKRAIPNEEELSRIQKFVAEQQLPADSTGEEIGAAKASLLGHLLLEKKYAWNTDFKDQAVCTDHVKEVIVNNHIKLILLGPNRGQLSALESAFEDALKKMKIEVSDTDLLDDAFELFSRNEGTAEADIYAGSISGSETSPITKEYIKQVKEESEYKADSAPGNGSSIAFVLDTGKKKILMLADAHAESIIEQLKTLYPNQEKIYFDAVKVPHHGSFNNNPKELYELIDSPLYLFSTNGDHPSHVHPDIETIALIIDRPLHSDMEERKLVFNYKPDHLKEIFKQDLMDEFHYSVEITNTVPLND